jgi:hypothetical protein
MFMEYQVVSATGAYNPAVTQSASGYTGIFTMALKLL